MVTIKKNKPITKELLQIVKDGFEEQKGIKVLSLYAEDDKIWGIYILPPQQSLSFNTEPLLDMMTDIDGHMIIMEELGQVLLYAYNMGSIDYFMRLLHVSDIDCASKSFDNLLNICISNPPLQRIDATLIEWLERTDEVHTVRTQTFTTLFNQYNQLDSIDVDTTISTDTHDDVYILSQFNEAIRQLERKNHKKITELIIHEINKVYINMQIDLYITDDK